MCKGKSNERERETNSAKEREGKSNARSTQGMEAERRNGALFGITTKSSYFLQGSVRLSNPREPRPVMATK